MICFRKFKKEDLDKVKDILNEEKISNLQIEDTIYVVTDSEDILGLVKVREEREKWFLQYLVVKKEMRGKRLGDGLIRVISNYLLKKGVERLYYQEGNEFLIKIGFKKNCENLYELDIGELFKHNCNNCGGSNEF